MSKKLGIEKILIWFENCDTMEIPGWFITDFYIQKIETQIARRAINDIDKNVCAKEVLFTVASEYETSVEHATDDDATDSESRDTWDSCSPLQKIERFRNLVGIEVFYERDYVTDPVESESFCVDWKSGGKWDLDNVRQHCYRNALGDLIVYVGKPSKLKRLAKKRAREKAERIKRIHEMYDIGVPFEPAHKFDEEHPEYPEIGRRVWLYDDENCSLVKFDGEKWVYEEGFEERSHPHEWQYYNKQGEIQWIKKRH